ncbi:amidohydrolase [Psychrosphaera saromensis]|uniref:Amidohydrolase n=2 Tax=Psychrosphaera saromensis TaxID=716813 RepID=A0A2S7UZ90_9GAMM|nr:amidohydrolase family protein [Psychrosphaera saromensis]PQJ54601.1 amidohydrolase [Psychrosphaera saromensis]
MMKLLKPSLIALSLLTSCSVLAEKIAITNTTIYTATDNGVLTNASVVFENGKIISINPLSIKADKIIDGTGKIVTPGLISTMNQFGLVEVNAVSGTRDASAKKGSINFDPSYAYNAETSLIPFARKGGITRSLITPSSRDSVFAGQAFTILMNSSFDSVIDTKSAVVASFGGESKDSRASSLIELIEKLKEQRDKLSNADDESSKKAKAPTDEEEALTALLNGEKPLVASASRSSDLLHLIKIKEEYGVHIVIAGGEDAARVKSQLAEAEIPVMIKVVANLPGSFDSLHASLTTAGELEKAGVKVILFSPDSHMAKNLRLDAGNAISYGMTPQGALEAMTSNVAEVFNMDSGEIAVGRAADLVLWTADPFEISSKVESLWINGEKVTTESRQDKLRDRYISKDNKPRGYIKP